MTLTIFPFFFTLSSFCIFIYLIFCVYIYVYVCARVKTEDNLQGWIVPTMCVPGIEPDQIVSRTQN